MVPNILAGKSCCGVYFFFFLPPFYSLLSTYNVSVFSNGSNSVAPLLCVELEELSLWVGEQESTSDPEEAKRTPPLMSPNSKLVLRIPEAQLCYSEDADVTQEAPT